MGINSSKVVPNNKELYDSLPYYFIDENITHFDYIKANDSWRLIVENKGKKYEEICKNNKKKNNKSKNICDIDDCVVLFYKIFYKKLFILLPEVQHMFHNDIEKQGRMLVNMITMILESFYNKEMINIIKELTVRHMKYGVKSYHYYIMGEVLFNSLNEILDVEFTDDCYHSWKKIYSSMLKIILPIIKIKENNKIINNIINKCNNIESTTGNNDAPIILRKIIPVDDFENISSISSLSNL